MTESFLGKNIHEKNTELEKLKEQLYLNSGRIDKVEFMNKLNKIVKLGQESKCSECNKQVRETGYIEESLIIQKAKADERERILKIIEEHQNPYPKDVFVWDSKEKCEFNRGRFNQHTFEIVENMREELKSQLEAKP